MKIHTFEEELNNYIEHDDIRGLMVLMVKNLNILEMDTKDDDEELKAWLKRIRPNYIEQIKVANIEFQKRLPKYIGNETTEGDLLEKLKALNPYSNTCIKDWYDEIASFKTIKTSHIGYYIDKYILNIEYSPCSFFGKSEYVYIADIDERVRADEFYPFFKKASAIALVYANEELLRRLGQLEDMTADENRNQRNNK